MARVACTISLGDARFSTAYLSVALLSVVAMESRRQSLVAASLSSLPSSGPASRPHQEEQSTSAASESIEKLSDYCQTEFFEVTCPRDHVLVILSAHYGRMRTGRCVTGSYGFIGCAVDVFPFLDRKCSGRAQCRMHTMDPSLHQSEPCPKDLTSYLEVGYQCVRVAVGSKHMCSIQGHIPLTLTSRGAAGYISSTTVTSTAALDHGYGTKDCPWRIQVSPGQRMRLTQTAFAGLRLPESVDGKEPVALSVPDVCYEVGFIREDGLDWENERRSTLPGFQQRLLASQTLDPPGFGKSGSAVGTPLKVCATGGEGGGRGGRNGSVSTVMYVSHGSTVFIRFHSRQVLQELSPFLIKYEAEGCATLATPTDGWIRAEADRTVLGCNNVKDVWHLKCFGNDWLGETPNCTASASISTQNLAKIQDDETFPLGILIVVAIGVALGVFIGGALLSVVSIIRKRRHDAQMQSAVTSSNTIDIDRRYDDTSMTSYPQHQALMCTFPRDAVGCVRHSGAGDRDHAIQACLQELGLSPAHHRCLTNQLSLSKYPCPDDVTPEFLCDGQCVIKGDAVLSFQSNTLDPRHCYHSSEILS